MSEKISVVMPVRNEIEHIDSSVASILAQSHGDFELVIGDDGSTDGTGERLRQWAERDSRIRVAGPSGGLGPSGSSNWVVSLARCPIVARMDGDDISHPDRFAEQLRVLREHPEAVLVGTLFDSIDESGRRLAGPQKSASASAGLCSAPFAHGSIMFRRAAFDLAGGYRMECRYWEDQELYWRMAAVGPLLLLNKCLYSYRYSLGSARISHDREDVTGAMQLFYRCAIAHQQGRDYRELLESRSVEGPDEFALEAILAVGGLRLWAGSRPRIFGQVVRHAMHRRDRRALNALLLAALGEVSPRLARRMLRLRASASEFASRRALAEPDLCEWHPPPAPLQSRDTQAPRVRVN